MQTGSTVNVYKRVKSVNLDALNAFNTCKTILSRDYFCKCKKEHKKLIRKKKNMFLRSKYVEIEKLRFSKPKQFWQYFKKKKNTKQNNEISVENFYTHFKHLYNDVFYCNNEDANNFCEEHDFTDYDCAFDELNTPITNAEILNAVKSLKREKSAGPDFLLNEYFIQLIDILGSHICSIFNAIFESGIFLINIIPIY